MKIYPVQNSSCNRRNNLSNAVDKNSRNLIVSNPLVSNVAFWGNPSSTDFQSAKRYLDETKAKLGIANEDLSLKNFDLEKLNGIQKGIKVFDGLSMKQIAFVSNNLLGLSVNHGCSSMCAHCYLEAVPQYFKEDSNMINKIDFEDFHSFMGGYEKLNKRLGFNALKTELSPYFCMFGDSDCIDMEMKDKSGKIYDFTYANDVAYKSTQRLGLFDTAGWYPKNKKLQERAEKIVKYFSEEKNSNKVIQIAVSFNPFHALNERSINLKNKGDFEGSKKFRELYVDRMVNVFYTFTPVIENEKFHCMSRSMLDSPNNPDGFQKKDLEQLADEVLAKLEKKYEEDYSGDKKYIKTPEQAQRCLSKLNNELKLQIREIGPEGRAENLYKNNAEVQEFIRKNKIEGEEELRAFSENLVLKLEDSFSDVDMNGKVYFLSSCASHPVALPTELQLNFKNKHKKTISDEADFGGKKITKEMIDRVF